LWFPDSVRQLTAEREGAKAFQAAKNHTFFVILLPKNAKERDQAATRLTIDLRLVDFLPIKNNWSGSLNGTDQKKGASFGHIDGTILTLAGLGSVSVRAGVCSSRGLLKARSDGFGR
jgi:hypothetical protein